MRRITGEQYERVESSQETLNKWYDFLKKGAKNSGFGPNVYEHLKPFELDCVVPSVNEEIKLENSGRIFYEMSLADKVRSWLMLNKINYYSEIPIKAVDIARIIIQVVANSLYYLLTTDMELPPIEGINMTDLKTNYADTLALPNSIFKKALYQILKSVEMSYLKCTQNPYTEHISEYSAVELIKIENPWSNDLDINRVPNIEDQILNSMLSTLVDISYTAQTMPLIKIKYFENIYVNKDLETILTSCKDNIRYSMCPTLTSTHLNIMKIFPQALNDSYMVLSLNPIDKIMASTKQPYGSCLSLAKEGSNDGATGTNIDNGTGLFAMMPSDKVYMIYYCNGKHKNMYWEKEEWDKLPEDRDKDKAYKFFKYSLRQFGYVCTSNDDPEKERILPGRTYLAQYEERRIFELINAILLDEAGIQTSWSIFREKNNIPAELLVKGEIKNPDYCWYDNYRYARGIYFDNVEFSPSSIASKPDSIAYTFARIRTGYGRNGSNRITYFGNKCPCFVNTFDLLAGKIPYDQYNTNVQICAHCGKLISKSDDSITVDSRNYCSTCATNLHIKKCEACGQAYMEEQAEEHRIIDLSQYLPYPERLGKEGKICMHQLKQVQYTDYMHRLINDRHLCPFCGNIETDQWYITNSNEENYCKQFTFIEIEGLKIKLKACNMCLRDSVICDCCKKLILLTEDTFPVVLMGNKRIICPDCLEKIRLKKQKKEALKEVVQELIVNKEEHISKDDDPQNISSDVSKLSIEDNNKLKIGSYGCGEHKDLKDINLQITSMTNKRGKGYPAIAGIK